MLIQTMNSPWIVMQYNNVSYLDVLPAFRVAHRERGLVSTIQVQRTHTGTFEIITIR